MAFGGDVDTLSLTFDKLQYIFRGYDEIREAFVSAHRAFREGSMPDAQFFTYLEDGVRRFSALEFLALKAVFEVKKALDRGSGVVRLEDIAGATGQVQPSGHSISSFIAPAALQRPDLQPSNGARTCNACGAAPRSGALFCTNCGRKL